MSETPLPWTERLCCVTSTSTYWYLGKALSHGKVAQCEHGHSKGGTDRPRRDLTWVPEAGRGAMSDWRHIQGCKSPASRVRCVSAWAVQNWCSSLLLGLLFSRFYTDYPVPHFSLFTHFKNISWMLPQMWLLRFIFSWALIRSTPFILLLLRKTSCLWRWLISTTGHWFQQWYFQTFIYFVAAGWSGGGVLLLSACADFSK